MNGGSACGMAAGGSAKRPEGTCKGIYHQQDTVCGHSVASTDFMGDDDILWSVSVGSNDGDGDLDLKSSNVFCVLATCKVSPPPERQE